jgi:hypothetical protein
MLWSQTAYPAAKDTVNDQSRIPPQINQSYRKGTANNGPTNTLFFTAGPDDETHGLFGTITAD